MTPRFVHVRVHTEYSLVDGLIRVPALLRAVRDAGMPAVAVTDQGNLFALVKFYQAAMAAGVKPVVGVDLRVAGVGEQAHRLTLLCQDAVGYRNLTRLVSRSYLEGQAHGLATVQPAWLEEAAEGLIAISGGPEGAIGQALLAGRVEDAHRLLAHWRRHFPDRLYLEVLRTGREREEEYREAVVDLAVREGVPLVATNDVRFLAADDFEAHEARVCIQDGRTLDDPHRPRRYSPQQYLKCPAEMHALFADLPDALENTVEIARRCNLELSLGKTTLPAFPVPPDEDEAEFFARQAREGLARRLATVLPPAGDPARAERQPVYEARLEEELGVIQRMGFAGYFLIVADFIRWARDNGIPVGPGRGSGAGSLVAYALGITDLDPLAYDLLFERFLNPERVSMPDFDIDFCMEGRDRVIEYVADRYGRDRVSQIITHGSMAAKAVVRDVGRVLGYAYGFVDRIAKLIPFDPKMTLDKAIEDEEELRRRYEQEDEVRGLIDLARKLEGLARNAGRHAGGVVIAPSPLTDFTPLYCEEGATGVVTQLDKDDVEAMGLVKFDFLGLRTLTIIDWAVAIVNRAPPADGEPPLDIGRIPVDDRETFELVKRAATTAVFQLESHGMKNLIRRLQPDCFEDVIALVALFRPGPLQSGMVDDFIARKHGRARVEYPHPDLVPILKPTYGVILYQEQVMQIARVLAGYTLGGADLLRRAMGKKKPEEMAKQREVFLQGATARGVSGDAAAHIFDLMEKFAGYGFNKSHSAAYALVAYQTAWLKAHHPAAFMAATLSADMDKTDKVVGLIEECRQTGLSVLPPDVNRCEHRFTVEGSRTIRYGLGAIKGVGEGAVAALVAERAAHGPYRDLADFCRRVELRKLNRRMLEAMIRAGAFDGLGLNRASLMGSLTAVLQFAARAGEASAAGQPDLFGALGPPGAADATPPSLVTPLPDWPDEQQLAGEKETLGLYLTGHPIERYRAELAGFVTGTLADLAPAQGGTVVVAGLVTELRTINSRRGRMAVLTLDDRTARIGVVVYTELYTQRREVLAGDRVLVVEGELTVDDRTGGPSVVAQQVHDLDQARAVHARRLLIRIDATQAGHGFVSGLATVLKPFQEGRTPVYIEYRRPDASAELRLGDAWRVNPTEELLRRLGELAGSDRVRVEY